jgi:hypothetical protein
MSLHTNCPWMKKKYTYHKGWFKKNSLHTMPPQMGTYSGKNLQKSKKINTLDPKIRLKNYPEGSY